MLKNIAKNSLFPQCIISFLLLKKGKLDGKLVASSSLNEH